MAKYLFVVAHPDDEALGAGATMKRLSEEDNEVFVCVMNSVSDIRCKDSETMMDDMKLSHKILGVKDVLIGNFPTMKFNVTPEIELVEFIEKALLKFRPDYVFTHHPSDLHNDHVETAKACTTAVRLAQRQLGEINLVKGFYYMEVPSSTDWAMSFKPDAYSYITKEHLEAKFQSLRVYQEGRVLRDAPHPRSEVMLTALSNRRGAEIGYLHAEAFETVFYGGI